MTKLRYVAGSVDELRELRNEDMVVASIIPFQAQTNAEFLDELVQYIAKTKQLNGHHLHVIWGDITSISFEDAIPGTELRQHVFETIHKQAGDVYLLSCLRTQLSYEHHLSLILKASNISFTYDRRYLSDERFTPAILNHELIEELKHVLQVAES